ncbi:MAG: LytTR family transcriptional regulator [Lachnospiraceae bacterium]|nr:LytTR family transcriptional regulator [Lachnospiraceae bacterium]
MNFKTSNQKRKIRKVTVNDLDREETYRLALQLHARMRSKGESVKILINENTDTCRPVLYFQVSGSNSEICIPYCRILSIVSDRHYVFVRCTGGIQKKIRTTFRSVTEQLLQPVTFLPDQFSPELSPSEHQGKGSFLLVNRGVLVNMDHVRRIDKRTLVLDDGFCCTIHSRYAKKITEQYEMYLLRK